MNRNLVAAAAGSIGGLLALFVMALLRRHDLKRLRRKHLSGSIGVGAIPVIAGIGAAMVLGGAVFAASALVDTPSTSTSQFLAAATSSTAAGSLPLSPPPVLTSAAVDPSTTTTTDPIPETTTTSQAVTTGTPTPTTEPEPVVAFKAEAELAAATNQLRANLDLPQLDLDVSLRSYARNHAENMASGIGLVHSNIDVLLGPWQTVGENIGRDSSAEVIFDGLVGSPAHYALLVDPEFTATGVGAFIDQDGLLWICQIFGGPGATVPTTLPTVTIPIPTITLP